MIRKVTDEDKAQIAELFRRGLKGREIAEITGFETSTINVHINKMGLRKPEDKIPVYDNREQIEKCLHCEKDDCTNCVAYGGE